MNQDKNYISSIAYTEAIQFNLYKFKIFEEEILLIIKERIEEYGFDKSTYKVWETFFKNLSEGKDYKESSEQFIISFLEDDNFLMSGEKALDLYYKHPNMLLCHQDLEKIKVVYKKALRDRNIDSILEE